MLMLDRLTHHKQTTCIVSVVVITLLFWWWGMSTRDVLAPENRRAAAFLLICAHLFTYNVFVYFEHDTGHRLRNCVLILVGMLCGGEVFVQTTIYRRRIRGGRVQRPFHQIGGDDGTGSSHGRSYQELI